MRLKLFKKKIKKVKVYSDEMKEPLKNEKVYGKCASESYDCPVEYEGNCTYKHDCRYKELNNN